MRLQADVGSDTSAYDRERRVVRSLRGVVIALFVLGALAIVSGSLPEGLCITDRDYRDYLVPAGGALSTTLALLALVPGIAVFWRPRWPQILGWMAIDVWGSVVFVAIRHSILPGPVALKQIAPLWPAVIHYACLAAIALGVVVVIPSIRGAHPSPPLVCPPRLPRARVVRG